MPVRSFRDRDFIETTEGLLMCVVGNVHPDDRVICYLKYIPGHLTSAVRTKWSRRGVIYSRILPYYSAEGVAQVKEFLRRHYPHYLVHDEVLGIETIEVNVNCIKKHYLPERRLKEVLRHPRDPLESMAKEMVEILSSSSGVPLEDFGITGSILLQMHNPAYSDVDLTVYGRENAYRVKETLLRLYEEENSSFRRVHGAMLESWARDIVKIHALTLAEAKKLYGYEKWNRALFKGRQFSIHPVKKEEEVNERYGDKVYRGVGIAKIRCQVVDSKDSIFLPAVYKVTNVIFMEGVQVKGLEEIVSYEGLYCDIAKPGEVVYAYGKVEEVIDRVSGRGYYRLVIGTYEAQGRDYLKPERWLEPSMP